jgi:uncharacterized protein
VPLPGEMIILKKAFNILAKPIGPICNLNCRYCFYLEKEKLYPKEKKWKMSPQVLERFVQQYIESQDVDQIHFVWQGGEPALLGVEFFEKVVAMQGKYSNGKQIMNAFQTNGVLLNDAWCAFFAENHFLIGLSIDGPQHLHDQYRMKKGGQSAFDSVLRGIGFLKKHQIAFNTLTAINRTNAYHPIEVYQFLKEIGQGFMQFIPIVERNPSDKFSEYVTEWSVESDQFGTFLCEIFGAWVRNDVGKIFIQTFDVALESWVGMHPNLCVFSETCGKALALEHNGDLYACDHFVFPEYKIGNIMEQPLVSLVESEKQIRFGKDKKDRLPEFCLACDVHFACRGGCPKNRLVATPDGEAGLNYLCEGYQTFFHLIAPYMRFMAGQLKQQKPPASVMDWAREKDRGFPHLYVDRNDPCPCGSGKKYKHCHGK